MENGSFYEGTSMPGRNWWAAMFGDPAAILRTLGICPDMTVLDLCCGDGYFTAPLASMVTGRVYALDLDGALIERAKAEVARQGLQIAKWMVADARQADVLLPEHVDYVLMTNTFHGVDDRPALVATMVRCLNEGGRVGLLNWQTRSREETIVMGQPRGPATELRMPPADAAANLEQGGFTIERIVNVPPYHYGVVARLSGELSL